LSYVVILSPSLVILSEAKNLSSSAQGKLREESIILISNQCEMLRGVYPERGMKGILRCAQNDKRRACPERSEWGSAWHFGVLFISLLLAHSSQARHFPKS